jgi:hypothetical protein
MTLMRAFVRHVGYRLYLNELNRRTSAIDEVPRS